MDKKDSDQNLENNKPQEKKQEKDPDPSVLSFTKALYAKGMIPKNQVDAMEKFTKGEMDYGTMRSLCG